MKHFLVLVIILSEIAVAQEILPKITITSNVPHAKIFVDSLEVGITPLVGFAVAPGVHNVCVVFSEEKGWMTRSSCELLTVREGGEHKLHFSLPRQITVTSEPYGASVVYKDSVLGETPYILSAQEDVGTLQLSKEGYNAAMVVFDGGTSLLHGVLTPQQILHENPWLDSNDESNSMTPVIISASSAVLTGVVAAYWKLRADNIYNDYRLTGDPGRLNEVRRLDVASGIAFGVSQISLALLTYFLLSQ